MRQALFWNQVGGVLHEQGGKSEELPLQRERGNSTSAHTFNYVCHRHTEDKGAHEGHKHGLDGEHVTLKAAIHKGS